MNTPKTENLMHVATRISGLLETATLNESSDSFAAKDLIRHVLGPLRAANKTGISFERLAELINSAGISIAPSTLRKYYFELKQDKGLAYKAEKRAARILKMRK